MFGGIGKVLEGFGEVWGGSVEWVWGGLGRFKRVSKGFREGFAGFRRGLNRRETDRHVFPKINFFEDSQQLLSTGIISIIYHTERYDNIASNIVPCRSRGFWLGTFRFVF